MLFSSWYRFNENKVIKNPNFYVEFIYAIHYVIDNQSLT